MGDVLPPKRQTVVERLKRRFDLYRRHQNACLPRYEQAEHGIYESQRQETLLLKQRYLESKAKKAKSNKSDHHRTYKEAVTDSAKAQHAKPLKRPAEEPLPNPPTECANSEDAEKPAKILRTDVTSDKLPDLQTQQKQQQPNLPSFSVQIVQQFTKTSHGQKAQTIQTNVTVQALTSPLPQPPSNTQPQESVSNSKDSQQNSGQAGKSVECKQEKDCSQSDLCQFKSAQNSNSDRLSDTFPSLGFTDDSGDDVIHPDLLKDLIDDVFTNSADIMKDFNFDDSVGSIKDQEDDTKDIISDLVKESSPLQLRPFQTDSVSFVSTSMNPQQQHNELFKNISSTNEASMTAMISTTASPTTTTTNFYNASSQRLPSYSSSSLTIPNGLNLDFKLTEPNQAALTLKQMAEQHQNMQKQQQLVNSPLTNRPLTFNQDTFNSHINSLRSPNYLPAANPSMPSSNPKTPSSNMFSTFDRQMSNMNNFTSNEPLNNMPINPTNIFETDIRSRTSNIPEVDRSKQASCHNMQPQKPPAYVPQRSLTHFPENPQLRLQNPSGSQQRTMNRQFQSNMQLPQAQQMHTNQGHHNNQQIHQNTHDIKQPQHHLIHQPQSNPYVNFASQQTSNITFHASMSQNLSYNTNFPSSQTVNRTPPEYKAHHPNLSADNVNLIEQLNTPSHVMFNHPSKNKFVRHQKPPNVTITPDGSAVSSSIDWRHMMNDQQNNQYRISGFQDNYGNFNRNEHTVQQSQMFNQYRMPSNQMTVNRMIRPNMVSNNLIMQQRQRINIPQRQRNPTELEQQSSMALANNVLSVISSGYNSHQDMSRNDGSQINLDFLDNIESSASDLLNFDQVMQSSGTHFPLLDDMEILGK